MSDDIVWKRILDKVIIDPITGCWLHKNWNTKIRPQMYFNGKLQYLSRVVYQLKYKENIEGFSINHKRECNNDRCFNPEHLYKGTYTDNMYDRYATGYVNPMSLKTKCKRGHEFTPENTIIKKSGARNCRACNKIDYERSNSLKTVLRALNKIKVGKKCA